MSSNIFCGTSHVCVCSNMKKPRSAGFMSVRDREPLTGAPPINIYDGVSRQILSYC